MSSLHNLESDTLLEAIENHLDNFVEEQDIIVFHETEADIVHTDIFWIKPNSEYRPFSILMTCGLSAKAMSVPDATYDAYAEVVMLLPKEWMLENGAWNDEKNGWPLHHLRTIAKLPYLSNTWVGFGHTVAYDVNTSSYFPGTSFNSTILISSKKLPESFTRIPFGANTIKVFSAVPLYPEELQFKRQHDANALIEKFINYEIEEVLNPNRINTCK